MCCLHRGVWLLVFCWRVAFAADVLPAVKVVEDEEMISHPGDVVLSETTAASTVVSGESLRRPGSTLTQVLARQAGVQIRSSGGLGSYSTATLRGASSDQVMVYLDGLLLNDAAGGGVNLANIELLQVGSVEIYRGMTPVQLSKASLGGAINLRSLDLNGKTSIRGLVGVGSFDTRQGGVLLNGSTGSLQGLLSFNTRRSDNNFPFRNDNGTALNATDDFHDHRNNAAVDQSSMLIKIGRQASKTIHQDVSLQYFGKSQQIPDANNSVFNHAALDTGSVRFQFKQHHSAIWNSAWNRRFGVELSRKRETYRDLQSKIGLGQQHTRWLTKIVGLNDYWENVGETQTFSLGANLHQESYLQTDLLDLFQDSHARRRELTVSAQESLFLGGDDLLLTPGIHFDAVNDHFDVAGVSFGSQSLERQLSHQHLSPKIGLRYELSRTTALTANIGKYQRIPSFFELFGDRGLFLGNASLKSESGVNADLGIRWALARSVYYFNNPSLQIGLYYSNVQDAISRVYNARGIGKSINIEGALIRGMEWDASTDVGKRLHVQIKGAYQDTENRSFIPAFNGKSLPGEANFTINFYLNYQWQKAHFFYEYAGKFDSWYDTANLLPVKNQSVHTVGMKYLFTKAALAIELNNLTNDVYEDFNGYPKPGRTFYLTLTFPGE